MGTDFFIQCIFLNINKTDTREKVLTVRYSEATDCMNLSSPSETSIHIGNTITFGIELGPLGNPPQICFSATASVQGSRIAQIEGILETMIAGI